MDKHIASDYVPYQTYDMMKGNKIRRIDKKNYEEYVKNRGEYLRKMREMYGNEKIFEYPSVIELHKMFSQNEEHKYRYIIDVDYDNISKMVDINRTMYNKVIRNGSNVGDIWFVPYIDYGDYLNVNTTHHNVYKNVIIVNNREAKEYIDGIFSDVDEKERSIMIGKCIHSINNIMMWYSNVDDLLGKLGIDDKMTYYDKMLELERRIIYNFDKRIMRNVIDHNRNMVKNIKKVISENMDFVGDIARCNKKGSHHFEYYEALASKKVIEENMEMMKRVNACDAYLNNVVEVDDYNVGIDENNCGDMKTCKFDVLKYYSYDDVCDVLVYKLKNVKVRDFILGLSKNNIVNSRCCAVPDSKNISFDVNEESMPEWHEALYNGDFEEAYKHRQLCLGNLTVTNTLRLCSVIFRSDPLLSKKCNMYGVSYDIYLNKLFLLCQLGKSDIFPVRIIDVNRTIDKRIYNKFLLNEYDVLLGSFVIPVKDEDNDRHTVTPCYVLYLYYNKKKEVIHIVNYRGNNVYPGSIVDAMRVINVEFNIMMYIKDAYPDMDLHFYRKNHEDDDDFDVYISKYDMNVIRKKYEGFKSFVKSDVDKFLDSLLEVKILKDDMKFFYFDKL